METEKVNPWKDKLKHLKIIILVSLTLILILIISHFFIKPIFFAAKTKNPIELVTPKNNASESSIQVPASIEVPKATSQSQAEAVVQTPASSTVQAPTNGGRPKINGNSDCVSKTNAALDLIQSKAPDNYSIVTTYTGIIECADSGSGMYAWESPPRFLVGAETMNAGTIWYAGTIVHDSGHSKLYHDYLAKNPGSSVPSEIWTGKDAEQKCLDLQYDALSKMGASQSTLDYVKNVINTDYWNNPNRWW